MENIPIQLNFFRTAEVYAELRELDAQYDRMMKDTVKSDEYLKGLPSSVLSINLPTWNIEKKLMRWSILKHKHLGSPITVSHLKERDFQKDIYSSNEEISFVGAKHVIENMVAHGYAEYSNNNVDGILINQKGLFAGSIIARVYNEKIIKVDRTYGYSNLVPLTIQKCGYWLLYATAWAILFEMMAIVSMQLLSLAGLIDNAKILFGWAKELDELMVVLCFLPLILLSVGIGLILMPSRNYMK